ncbi:nicotinate phosphoribosyltransferase [Choiromyces venosus 120613-1]|uniref:Nicotinate phosphoribosyltransferase n=1 Tax=Choiromyces venosus 120613-1 TaxID=1336337 RepID=A0A3N4JTN8_9PEZI|nr:nicotinate phosphoribosyltransferase [Choiromyces venosus 120613-1]
MSDKSHHGTEAVEGIASLIDTDLYKLTMQCAVLKSYPDVDVTYAYTNRTPDLKLSREGFEWIETQVAKLGQLRLSQAELEFLQRTCPYLPKTYLAYLEGFSFKPDDQIILTFTPDAGVSDRMSNKGNEKLGKKVKFADDGAKGDVRIDIKGKWVETILYEIPLLVLVSEAYFKFSNADWNYEGQEEKAYAKGLQLLENGCLLSEFGTRRRRSYHTQELVLNGLVRAMADYEINGGGKGKLSGTSNVHFAHRMGLNPIGTVAHEWFMGIAAITNDYTRANEIGLRQWIDCFGEGVLSIALTDTFGTPHFLRNFSLKYPPSGKSYAEIFAGVRQDSGDPEEFVKCMRKFYDEQGIKSKKTIVFSDSLDVDLCLKYKEFAEREGFMSSFGVGTFLTNDFVHLSNPSRKSWPLNIVIKINSANGKPAVKISDNISKNTGDQATVEKVKQELGYVEKEWEDGNEQNRWRSRT